MYSNNDWRTYTADDQNDYESFMNFLHHYDVHDYDDLTPEDISEILYSCEHSWGTSPAAKALEKAYNAWYYMTHKNKWGVKELDEERMKDGQQTIEGINGKITDEIEEKKQNLRNAYEDTKKQIKNLKDNPGQLKKNFDKGVSDIKSMFNKRKNSGPTYSQYQKDMDAARRGSRPIAETNSSSLVPASTRNSGASKPTPSYRNTSLDTGNTGKRNYAQNFKNAVADTQRQISNLRTNTSNAVKKVKADVAYVSDNLKRAKRYDEAAKTSQATAKNFSDRAQNAYVNLYNSSNPTWNTTHNSRLNDYDRYEQQRLNEFKVMTDQNVKWNQQSRDQHMKNASDKLNEMISWDYVTNLLNPNTPVSDYNPEWGNYLAYVTTGDAESDNKRRNSYANGTSIQEIDEDAKKRRR